MSLSQRFTEAVEFLISEGKTKNKTTFAQSIGISRTRYSTLSGGDAKQLKPEERLALQKRFPEISWANYVELGEQPMLLPEPSLALEDQEKYTAKVWQRVQIREILSGVSTLSHVQQIELLKEAYVELANELSETQEKIIQIQEISQGNLIDELKALIKRKR